MSVVAFGSVLDGKYEIISRLGVGGFGIVYQARHAQLDRLVALKILKEKVDEETSARLTREAQTLSCIQHRNVVRFLDHGIHDGRPYIATEFVAGQSLEKLLLSGGRLDWPRILSIFQQICDGLTTIHAHGIVHRDLKPGNILLVNDPSNREVVKIIDFGLVKLLPQANVNSGLQQLTDMGQAVGSVHYMSPEQCLGRPADARADIYAVGCMLYECVTGHPPFDADAAVAIMYHHLNDSPGPLVTNGQTDAIASLQSVLDQALAKDPADRFQSAEELKSALLIIADRWKNFSLQGATVSALIEGTPPRPFSTFWKKSLLVGVSFLAVIGTGLSIRSSIEKARRALPPSKLRLNQSDARILARLDTREADFSGLPSGVSLFELLSECHEGVTQSNNPAVTQRISQYEVRALAFTEKLRVADSVPTLSTALEIVADDLRRGAHNQESLRYLLKAFEITKSSPARNHYRPMILAQGTAEIVGSELDSSTKAQLMRRIDNCLRQGDTKDYAYFHWKITEAMQLLDPPDEYLASVVDEIVRIYPRVESVYGQDHTKSEWITALADSLDACGQHRFADKCYLLIGVQPGSFKRLQSCCTSVLQRGTAKLSVGPHPDSASYEIHRRLFMRNYKNALAAGADAKTQHALRIALASIFGSTCCDAKIGDAARLNITRQLVSCLNETGPLDYVTFYWTVHEAANMIPQHNRELAAVVDHLVDIYPSVEESNPAEPSERKDKLLAGLARSLRASGDHGLALKCFSAIKKTPHSEETAGQPYKASINGLNRATTAH